MVRTKAAKKPGTERYRDERRVGGPRMHGRQWHDHEEVRELEPEVMAAPDAVPEVEGGGERGGMGRVRVARKTKGSKREQQVAPARGKGPKKKPGGAARVKRGQRGSGRA